MDDAVLRKVCFKCNEEKSIEDFYKHKAMGDGHLGKCKDCTKKDVHENRVLNIDRIREYDRERGNFPHRLAKGAEYLIKYRADNPEKNIARGRAATALRNGKIKRTPCTVCGTSERLEMHHTDYAKPLEVIFLCSMHHKRAHGMGTGY